MAESSENTPLLSLGAEASRPPTAETLRYRRRVLAIVFVSVIAADFGDALSLAPQLQIYESLICKRFRGEGSADGSDFCKSAPVQDELARLMGWKATFDQIPSLALVLLYGFAADRIGRKPVLLLALAGLFLEECSIRLVAWGSLAELMPLRLIWLTPLFQIIGGGSGTATSMAYSIITDTFPASQRASVYFLLGAALLVGEILAIPLSAFLTQWTPWIPSLGGIVCQIVGLLAAACLPETKVSISDDTTPEPQEPGANGDAPTRKTSILPIRYKTVAEMLRRNWKAAKNSNILSPSMACMIASFLMASIGSSSLPLIIQYASKRFSWSIARASLLMSIKGAIKFGCLLIVLPYVSRVLSSRVGAAMKDLRIVQGSVIFWTIGLALMAFASGAAPFIAGISILSLGSGYFSALRSLANSWGTPEQTGLINSLIGFAMSSGLVVAGPSLAAAFQRGMSLGSIWMGLPFMIAAALFMGATCLAWCIRISASGQTREEQATAEDADERGY